jgi:hypothetical protein
MCLEPFSDLFKTTTLKQWALCHFHLLAVLQYPELK